MGPTTVLGGESMARRPKEPRGEQRWPSVEEQIAAAGAIHGSAFEQFIRLNQDFELLRPEENIGDGIGYPPWLRVYWRKQHPDESYSVAGPAAEYPEMLNRIQEWMQL